MAKKKSSPERIRKVVTISLDPELLVAARSIGIAKAPPWKLARVVDEALADWIVKHGPKGRAKHDVGH
jgi:hypothetical protein